MILIRYIFIRSSDNYGHGGGKKIWVSGKNLGWEEKYYKKIFAFPRKNFAFSCKDICVRLQNQLVHIAPYVHNGAVHRVLF